MRIAIEALTYEHLQQAAETLAARHRRDRLRFPALPAAMEDPARMRRAYAFSYKRSRGAVAATIDGRFAGYLFAEVMHLEPNDLDAMFYHQRSALVPAVGHATIDDLDHQTRTDLYRRMYAAASGAWLAVGARAHYVKLTAGDADVFDAWTSLGFGGHEAFGIRATEPLERIPVVPDVEVRGATPADLDVAHQLLTALSRYHSGPPMFYPYLPSTEPAQRAALGGSLRRPDDHYLLAWQGERAVGLLGIQGPFGGELDLLPRDCPHIHFAWVEPALHGGGVGRLLLEHGLAWMRERGYPHCSVGWGVTNLSAHRFWLAAGFEISGLQLHRMLDQRVTSNQ